MFYAAQHFDWLQGESVDADEMCSGIPESKGTCDIRGGARSVASVCSIATRPSVISRVGKANSCSSIHTRASVLSRAGTLKVVRRSTHVLLFYPELAKPQAAYPSARALLF